MSAVRTYLHVSQIPPVVTLLEATSASAMMVTLEMASSIALVCLAHRYVLKF